MPTVTNDGTEIQYTVDGNGGPVVVAVSGLGYGRWMWRFLTEALADAFTVVRPDNRGAGGSDAPAGPYTIEEMASDVRAVVDAVDPDDVHLVGASMGGMIALSYAHAYDDVETLSLVCTSPGGTLAEPTPPEVIEYIMSAPSGADDREVIRHRMQPAVSDDFFTREPDLVERIVDWRLDSDADDDAREAQAAAVTAFDASDWLDEIDVPTLVLHGTEDRVLPVGNADVLAEHLPNPTVEYVEGGHHLVFVEHRETVNDRIRTFLETHR